MVHQVNKNVNVISKRLYIIDLRCVLATYNLCVIFEVCKTVEKFRVHLQFASHQWLVVHLAFLNLNFLEQ